MNILMKSSKLIPIARGLWQFEVLDFEVDNIAPLKPFCRLNWKKLQKPIASTFFYTTLRKHENESHNESGTRQNNVQKRWKLQRR